MTPQFPYVDYRSRMPRAKWSIGTRVDTRYFTLHYNGPAVKSAGNPAGEIAQLQFDAAWHMRPGALGAKNGGDGIQYHGATLSNGVNLQLRDWSAVLWHCGNRIGNERSIAWHVPIGDLQQPSPVQLHQLFNVVIPAFQREYHIVTVAIKGHKEWRATNCPGTLMHYLLRWRDNQSSINIPLSWYRTLTDVFVRETPEIVPDRSNVALDGKALIAKSEVFAVDVIVPGKPYQNISTYLHRADQLGFMLNDPRLLEKLV